MYNKSEKEKPDKPAEKPPQVFVERTLLMATYSVYKLSAEFGLSVDVFKSLKIGAEVKVDEVVAGKMVEKGLVEIIKEVSDG